MAQQFSRNAALFGAEINSPITASELVASLGDAKNFDGGRQVAAWLGLVPSQHSSGGKQNLLGMSKRGDTYLRTLLIHGARSVIYRAGQKADPDMNCKWVNGVVNRRNKNVAAVALANKNARIAWAFLAHDREFRSDYTTTKVAAWSNPLRRENKTNRQGELNHRLLRRS